MYHSDNIPLFLCLNCSLSAGKSWKQHLVYVLLRSGRALRGFLRFKYRICSYADPNDYDDHPSSLDAYIRRSYVPLFEVNKYSTFILLAPAPSRGLRWLSEAKTGTDYFSSWEITGQSQESVKVQDGGRGRQRGAWSLFLFGVSGSWVHQ